MVALERLTRRDDLRLFRRQIVLLNAEFLSSTRRRRRRTRSPAVAAAAQHLLGVEPGKLLLDLDAEDSDDVDALLLVELTRGTRGKVGHEGDDAQNVFHELCWQKEEKS